MASIRTMWGDWRWVAPTWCPALRRGSWNCYGATTWWHAPPQLAVMRSVESDLYADSTHDGLCWDDVRSGTVRLFEATTREDMPADTRVTPFAGIRFSEDGRTVFVGVRPWERVEDDEDEGEDEEDEEGADSDDDVDPADVQIWQLGRRPDHQGPGVPLGPDLTADHGRGVAPRRRPVRDAR